MLRRGWTPVDRGDCNAGSIQNDIGEPKLSVGIPDCARRVREWKFDFGDPVRIGIKTQNVEKHLVAFLSLWRLKGK